MNRISLIRLLIKKRKLNNYLEIGVFNGKVLFRVKATFKIAVDPAFKFDALRKLGKTFLNPYNLFNRYFRKTSDRFFAEDAPALFAHRKIGIALVDGMHEYQFALRDVENTLRYLDDNGVIIMHDCNPLTPEAAGSFEAWKARDFTGQWNGDVWKAILYLRSTRPDVHVFVLDCDHGLGVITKGTPESMLSYTPEEIADFTYADFDRSRREWLNLKPAGHAHSFFGI